MGILLDGVLCLLKCDDLAEPRNSDLVSAHERLDIEQLRLIAACSANALQESLSGLMLFLLLLRTPLRCWRLTELRWLFLNLWPGNLVRKEHCVGLVHLRWFWCHCSRPERR